MESDNLNSPLVHTTAEAGSTTYLHLSFFMSKMGITSLQDDLGACPSLSVNTTHNSLFLMEGIETGTGDEWVCCLSPFVPLSLHSG